MSTEPTPAVVRAAEVLSEAGHARRTMVTAREVLVEALDMAEIAAVLRKHRRDGRKSWTPRVVCICGWVGDHTEHETHVAAAVHVALTGEEL